MDRKCRRLAWGTHDRDRPPKVSDHGMDHDQPEPSALPHVFGGEKRLEDALQNVWGHAMTGVQDGQAERWPRLQGRMGHREVYRHLDRVETHLKDERQLMCFIVSFHSYTRLSGHHRSL
jgi:hypothetical protein